MLVTAGATAEATTRAPRELESETETVIAAGGNPAKGTNCTTLPQAKSGGRDSHSSARGDSDRRRHHSRSVRGYNRHSRGGHGIGACALRSHKTLRHMGSRSIGSRHREHSERRKRRNLIHIRRNGGREDRR